MKNPTQTHCIPIGAQSNDHSARLAHVPSERFFTDALTFARVQLMVTKYYGFDMPINFWDVYNIEAEALGQTVVYHPDGIPDVDRTKPLIQTTSDLYRMKAPDPYKSGRMPWLLEVNRHYLEMTGKLERVYFTSPFSLAVNIRGYENLIFDMAEDPGFVHDLFKFLCDDVIAPFLETMRNEIGDPELILDGRDAWASPPMITLDMMDEYVVSYTERLRERLGDRLLTRGNWGDAKTDNPGRFFSQKLQCSPGSLSVLDPDLYEIGPGRVKTFAHKHNASVTAGVDAKLLRDGPIEAIVERLKLYLHEMARDGRCMIHLNHIPAETPPEHIHAAVAACHTYGQLPIPGNMDDIQFQLPERKSFLEFAQENGMSFEA